MISSPRTKQATLQATHTALAMESVVVPGLCAGIFGELYSAKDRPGSS